MNANGKGVLGLPQVLKRIVNFVLYGGSTRLRSYEEHLLGLAKEVLPTADQQVLEEQLSKLQRIKRYNADRMVTFQFDGVATPLLSDRSPELLLVSFLCRGAVRYKPLAALMTHRGRISSLEFKREPLPAKPDTWLEVVARFRGADPDLARAIDREEHDDSDA